MDIKDSIKKIQNRDISRREFTKALAAVGLTTAMMPLGSKAARADDGGEAIYYTWPGYDLPEFLGSYVEKHGTMPNLPIFGDVEEAFTKIRAGFKVDVTHPCSFDIPRWREAGVIQAIDTSKLSNWPDVIPKLKTLDGIQHNGEQFFVPWDWGQTSITYRTDLVDLQGEEESWGLLWDERYAGRMSIIDAAEDAWYCAAIYAGVDVNALTDADLKIVFDLMVKQQPLLRFRSSDMTSVGQALASGELVAAMTWNEVPLQLLGDGVPVKFMAPKEGALTWVCGVVLLSDAPHYDKAHDLIDAMLATASGEFLIGDYGYGHSNAKAFDLISDEDLAARGLTSDPNALLDAGIFVNPQPEETLQKINRDWGDIIAG